MYLDNAPDSDNDDMRMRGIRILYCTRAIVRTLEARLTD